MDKICFSVATKIENGPKTKLRCNIDMFKPAVVRVRMPSSTQIFAFNDLVIRNAGRRFSWRVLTIVVTLITNGSAIAPGLGGEVTSHVGQVEHHWARTIVSIWTHNVLGITALDTVPVFPAVVLVREVSVTRHLAINWGSGAAVLGGCGRGGGGRAVGGVVAGAGPAVHIIGEGAPVVPVVVLEVILAGLVGDAALAALVVLPARLGVRLCHVVLWSTDCTIWQCVVTLSKLSNIDGRATPTYIREKYTFMFFKMNNC